MVRTLEESLGNFGITIFFEFLFWIGFFGGYYGALNRDDTTLTFLVIIIRTLYDQYDVKDIVED